MRKPTALPVVALLCVLAAPARAEVHLSIPDGRVSLSATNATIGDILAEWARIGRTTIVNDERVPGASVTIQLNSAPKKQALEIILRSVAGYVTATRPAAVANTSFFNRILVMPTSSPTSAPTRAAAPQPPALQRPLLNLQFERGQVRQGLPRNDQDQDDDQHDEPAPNLVPTPRGPIFGTFPQPTTSERQPGVSSPAPGQVPVGVAVRSMVVPVPARP